MGEGIRGRTAWRWLIPAGFAAAALVAAGVAAGLVLAPRSAPAAGGPTAAPAADPPATKPGLKSAATRRPSPRVRRGEFHAGACRSMPPRGRPRGRTVFLDPGHGGIDPGAQGVTVAGRHLEEKQATLAIARRAARLLVRRGFRVVLSRSGDTTVARLGPADVRAGALSIRGERHDVQARVDCADESGADRLVAVHLDSFATPEAYGATTFYAPSRRFSAASRRLARLVEHDVVDRLHRSGWDVPARGVRSDAGEGAPALSAWGGRYGHLLELGPPAPPRFRRASWMPGVLVEPLFVSTPSEASVAASRRGQAAIARGLADAVSSDLPRRHGAR